MLWKCYTQYASKFGKLSNGHRTRKDRFSFQSQRNVMPKNAQTSALVLMPHNRKAMLKILQDKLQQYMDSEHPDGQTGFRKSRGTKDQITNIFWIIKKAREFHKKHLLLLHWLHLWLYGSQKNCGQFFKRWEYQNTWPASWETCMQPKKQQSDPDMEQKTGSKSGKENVKAVYCQPAYSTYMQSTSWEMLGWMKHKLESRLPGEISIIASDMQMTPPLWQKAKKN